MKYLKKYDIIKKESENSNSFNEAVGDAGSKIDHYQKLFDEAYSKKDTGKCKEYDKILIGLHKQSTK
jgi:hypothetical protein